MARHVIHRHSISLQAGWRRLDAGEVGWNRRFGRPADLPFGERIVLVVEPSPDASRQHAASAAAILLNGRPVDGLPGAEVCRDGAATVPRIARDVTDALAPRNDLELRFAADGGPVVGNPGDHRPLPESVARVWLEIQSPGGGGDHS